MSPFGLKVLTVGTSSGNSEVIVLERAKAPALCLVAMNKMTAMQRQTLRSLRVRFSSAWCGRRKSLGKARLACAVLLVVVIPGVFQLMAETSTPPPPIRIMPLGASITKGVPIPGGYRAPLYNLLTNAGYTLDFIGTQRGSTLAPMPDVDHEGHIGYRLDHIDAGFTAWADQVADPDIIVLQVGSNDFAQNQDLQHITNRLDHLISRITQNRPQAKLIVCNLFLRTDYPDLNERARTIYNPFVPGIVARHAARGEEVWFVNLQDALSAEDLADGLHPNQIGYNKVATNIFPLLTKLITPLGVTNLLAITHAAGSSSWKDVTVTFNKPLQAESVKKDNFTLSGGLSVESASLDPLSQREVHFVTSLQKPSCTYTVVVSNIRELMPPHRAVPSPTKVEFQSRPTTGALNNVPEASQYTLVYSLHIPDEGKFNAQAVPYEVDNHLSVSHFSRIAYYLELQSTNGTLDFVWASMDAFTQDAGRIGVPVRSSGAFFQQPVSHLNVFSSVRSLAKGVGFSGGYLEFWPMAYTPENAAHLPNASSLLYDFSDRPSAGDFGSMQVHNIEAAQTVFGFNHWADGKIDLGIGNSPFGNPDWTFAANASQYTRKILQVFVLPERHAP
jgi:lysophospholipase L1-like esterase